MKNLISRALYTWYDSRLEWVESRLGRLEDMERGIRRERAEGRLLARRLKAKRLQYAKGRDLLATNT